jgi:hypothetical protein
MQHYSKIVSTLALFIALGGVSYAATALPANSVGTAQIQARSVTAGKLAVGVITQGQRGIGVKAAAYVTADGSVSAAIGTQLKVTVLNDGPPYGYGYCVQAASGRLLTGVASVTPAWTASVNTIDADLHTEAVFAEVSRAGHGCYGGFEVVLFTGDSSGYYVSRQHDFNITIQG